MKTKLFFFLVLVGTAVLMFTYKTQKRAEKLANKGSKAELKKIVQEQWISGYLEPVNQIDLKPQISGVIQQLYVKEGDAVKKGDLIARIRMIADPVSIEDAENNKQLLEERYRQANIRYLRNKGLFEQHVIALSEFQQFEEEKKLREQELNSIIRKISLLKKGFVDGEKELSNSVYSTIDGFVLSLPLKEGSFVIETNTFNEGSTIASIADMSQMLFKGKVSENDIQYLQLGMDFDLFVKAAQQKNFKSKLGYISPQGEKENGITKFEIEGLVLLEQQDSISLRSGYSAIAQLKLQETKTEVMTIKEQYLMFDKEDSVYVNLNVAGEKKKTYITIGLSDGINVEVKEGITMTDLIWE